MAASSVLHGAQTPTTTRIVAIGDVHYEWDEESAEALAWLKPDVSLFVGDFGEEAIEVVEAVASSARKSNGAVILGNHDAWNILYQRKKRRSSRFLDQLGILGDLHVGYSSKAFDAGISVVGARPCSSGGSSWGKHRPFYQAQYGVGSFKESAQKIVSTALAQPRGNAIVLLGHNGPTGLGSAAEDICGVDFLAEAGDFGDPDMEEAISGMRASHIGAPMLVVFGHMHESLHPRFNPPGGRRKMTARDDNGVVYVNAAVVPRIRMGQHHFVVIDVEQVAGKRTVQRVRSVWVSRAGQSGAFELTEEETWFRPSDPPPVM